jgi:hypothetical protein
MFDAMRINRAVLGEIGDGKTKLKCGVTGF